LAETRIVEETARYYREVDDSMPVQARAQHQQIVTAQRAEVDALAKPALAKAIEDVPDDPDVWKWRWTLAEILATDQTADGLAQARKLADAAEAGMPRDVPPKEKDRIAQLRKELNDRQ
jgi:hypothetical protein